MLRRWRIGGARRGRRIEEEEDRSNPSPGLACWNSFCLMPPRLTIDRNLLLGLAFVVDIGIVGIGFRNPLVGVVSVGEVAG